MPSPSTEPRPRAKRRRHDPFGHVEVTQSTPRRGNTDFTPTSAQRQMVTVFRAVTVPDHVIAHQLGISKPTLYRHFREELDHGRDLVVSQVAASVVKKAMRGDNQMIMFYLRTHGPDIWKTTQKLEHSGTDGAPLVPPVLVVSFLEDNQTVTLEADERASDEAA